MGATNIGQSDFVADDVPYTRIFVGSGANYGAKVKFTLVQAMKAQRGSRGIALLFL